MHPKTKYIFIASMDVTPEKEALFNELYDTEHVPLLLKVPGVLSAVRVTTEPLTMFVAGERKTLVAQGEPRVVMADARVQEVYMGIPAS